MSLKNLKIKAGEVVEWEIKQRLPVITLLIREINGGESREVAKKEMKKEKRLKFNWDLRDKMLKSFWIKRIWMIIVTVV